RHTKLGTSSDREGETVATEPARMIGVQDDVGGRIVRVGIHRIGAGHRQRGRKTDVSGHGPSDADPHPSTRILPSHPMFVNMLVSDRSADGTAGWDSSDLLALKGRQRTIHARGDRT